MLKILVLADDLTGAAEIGGIAFQFGLSVRIIFEPGMIVTSPEDVIIIDTNTRNLNPDKAFHRIKEIAAGSNFDAFDLVYKKVDSILRGPIVSEIKALLTTYKKKSTILVPSNPSRKRIIRSGKYYIGETPINQTEFRNDPEYPRLSENVNEMILDNSDMISTGENTDNDIERKILIPDITSKNDMEFLVSSLSEEDVLLAGAADFFKTILIIKMKLVRSTTKIPVQKFAIKHFIMGSHSETTRFTLSFLKQREYSYHHLPVTAIDNESEFNEWLIVIMKDMVDKKQIVVSGPVEHIKDRSKNKKILYRLANVAKSMIETSSSGTLFLIEGGETASTICRNMGWTDLQLRYVWNDGVVLLANKHMDIHIAIKPGSYFWPTELF